MATIEMRAERGPLAHEAETPRLHLIAARIERPLTRVAGGSGPPLRGGTNDHCSEATNDHTGAKDSHRLGRSALAVSQPNRQDRPDSTDARVEPGVGPGGGTIRELP